MTNDARTEVFTPPTSCALDPSISLPEYATATHIEPQPAWRTLNAARERAFTGEIKFLTTPQIVTYIDGGTVYFAERVGEVPLGERLVAAGVVTQQQLERGVVRVGGAEHLGRLFDRDESIDRDAVMVAVEAATDALVSELAAEVVSPIEVGAYRHHPSGVHRWFVAPADMSLARPVSDVAQVDRSVIDELPDVTTARTEVTIEWDHPAPTDDPVPAAPTLNGLGHPDTLDIGAELGELDNDEAAWTAREATARESITPDAERDETSWLNDFQIVWPDGTEESATPVSSRRPSADPDDAVSLDVPPASPPAAAPTTPDARHTTIADLPAPLDTPPATAPEASPPISQSAPLLDAPPVGTPEPVNGTPVGASASTDDGVQFAMPQIVIDNAPEPDADIPVDVADAVRRALRAIENAAVEPASLRQIDLEPLTMPQITLDDTDTADTADTDGPTAAHVGSPVVAEPSPLDSTPTIVSGTTSAVVNGAAPTVVNGSTPTSVAAPASLDEHTPTTPAPTEQPVGFDAPAPQPMSSFAPPTSDTRAEAIYARAAAEATSNDSATRSNTALGNMTIDSMAVESAAQPEPGQASVVFLDEDDGGGTSRKGALRRLIGSLRRSD